MVILLRIIVFFCLPVSSVPVFSAVQQPPAYFFSSASVSLSQAEANNKPLRHSPCMTQVIQHHEPF